MSTLIKEGFQSVSKRRTKTGIIYTFDVPHFCEEMLKKNEVSEPLIRYHENEYFGQEPHCGDDLWRPKPWWDLGEFWHQDEKCDLRFESFPWDWWVPYKQLPRLQVRTPNGLNSIHFDMRTYKRGNASDWLLAALNEINIRRRPV
ncbi:hypothetical protein HYH03_019011 [Edaphochlamys debaryana]|uniref:Uncharacterized protein n=1 Tax=Edaphochlamys debaryana TaxID=47281 RepID=A0A836BMS2_9CHLO|nr:hypothetical protein HYH03_019011 [Edaphochlamys debaryana]|eukprot:KAG2482037.1 hypothetical protein HYH03_019011 [Edaphochlamys debaryana]